MMEKRQFLEILKKYKEDRASAEELEFLRTYYNLSELEPDVLQFMQADEKRLIRDRIEHSLIHAMNGKYDDNRPDTVKKLVQVWKVLYVAASIIIVLGIGIYLFKAPGYPDRGKATEDLLANDIRPGKNIATITLADGKAITLSAAKTGIVIDNTKLTYNDGSAVEPSAQPQGNDLPLRRGVEMTLRTPRGGTYQITLSDGTKVWLNAASSLTYASDLIKQGLRKVTLEGEGYFEVAKDTAHPFIVSSKGQEIKVLGTHFNVNSYADEESVKTTLMEGSVRVAYSAQNAILQPGQQAIITGRDGIKVHRVNVNDVVAWKEGNFRFADQSINDIMKQIARWYDVEIVYEDDLSALRLNGSISRNRNVSQLLKMLGKTNEIHFKIEGRKIIVTK